MELVNVFDADMSIIGQKTVEDVHINGDWYETFHCWIIREYKGKKSILFQKRNNNKLIFPNMYDITAAVHLRSDEVPTDGIREVIEELNIQTRKEDLISLGVRVEVGSVGMYTIKEFCHTYFIIKNEPLEFFGEYNSGLSCIAEMSLEDGQVVIDENADIGQFCILGGQGGLYIGKYTMIAGGTSIISANLNIEQNGIPYIQQGQTRKGLHVGNNVWIGARVVITDGVTIGDNLVIGAGTVVTKNIPKNPFACGIPAEVKNVIIN